MAALRVDGATFQLQCEPGECGVSVETRPCTSESNSAHFRRLGPPPTGAPQWSCELLRESRARVFPGALPPAPSRCSRAEANEDP